MPNRNESGKGIRATRSRPSPRSSMKVVNDTKGRDGNCRTSIQFCQTSENH